MHASPITFACPACGECVAVDASLRETLIERGCVFCGAAVDATAFHER